MPRSYWLWVARPAYYLEIDGRDREILDPQFTEPRWWSCDEQTRIGDLILLYRTTPQKDFAFLIQAESDALELEKGEQPEGTRWRYKCYFRSLVKFVRTLPFSALHEDSHFNRWRAYKMQCQGIAFPIPKGIWQRLNRKLLQLNPDYKAQLDCLSEELSGP